MMQELDKRLAQLPKDWKEVMAQRNLTFHQMLTIASLIEREVVVDEERPIVSGIIHNRLKQGMPLQIDATVQYLFDKQRERLLFQDLLIESPYNTYLNKGFRQARLQARVLLPFRRPFIRQRPTICFM